MMPFVAAAVQIAPQPGPLTAASIKANLAHAAEWTTRCVESTGAELVVLPETATTGFTPGIGAGDLWDLVSDAPGPVTEPLAVVARQLGVHLVLGTYLRGGSRGTVHNAAVFLGPSGDVLGVYRKTHLFTGETVGSTGWVTPGEEVSVVDTPLARLGAVICFDGDYPELARILAVQGAEVIVRPSALLRSADIWELTTRARAYDNHVHVVAANAVGADPGGLLYFGNSLIVTPIAEVIARGTTHEGWVAARLDPQAFTRMSPGSSQPQLFDHLADRNVGLYEKYAGDLFRPAASPYPHG
ncbi:MAG: carbon-nitrogen hydrolase family protein [Pseudonocardiales bacterium]